MNIGERIKQKRLELNLSQDELAKKVGYKSRSSIQKIESARKLPIDKVQAMASALECSPSVLMGWEVNTGANVETEPGMAYTLAPLPSDISKEDQELLARYHNASPEDRAIVDLALKRSQQKS